MRNKKSLIIILNLAGNILILLSIMFLFFTFGPAASEEVKYQTREVLKKELVELEPPNTDFSIVIPKIGAVAPVIANTDPINPENYLSALRRGVAHAAGTAFPGEFGNTYIFAHSTDTFYNVGAYNAVFYLLGKLEEGDEIKVFYQDKEYIYIVQEKKVVSPEAVKYLGDFGGKTLTLQTCYPPGTTLKRLIVIAEQVEKNI